MRPQQQGLQEQSKLTEAGSSGWSWGASWTWRSFPAAAAAAAAMCSTWRQYRSGARLCFAELVGNDALLLLTSSINWRAAAAAAAVQESKVAELMSVAIHQEFVLPAQVFE
jgi:hypothetical protein